MWLAHALTLSRIPIAVVFWLTYGDKLVSLALVVVAALTDAADGTVARWVKRRTGSQSTLGEWLDPAADKIFVLLVLGAIQVHDPVPWPLMALIVARELVLVPVAMIYRTMVHGRGEHAFKAGALGKAATIAELAAIVAIIVHSPFLLPIAIAAGVLGLGAVITYIERAQHSKAHA
jgi:cardiolipin synthase (CMP-forming)